MRVLLFAILLNGCGGVVQKDATVDAGTPLGVLVFENADSAPTWGSFYGVFYPDAQHASGGCTTTGSGACSVWTCSPDTSSAISAGTLALTDGTNASGSTTQSADGTYDYAVPAFQKGDVLGVAATGAQAPAFATQTVVAPGAIAVTSPQVPIVFSTTTGDVTVAWSGGEPNAQVFFEVAGSGSSVATFVLCHFDAASGSGVIPTTTLAALHPVSGEKGALLWGQERKVTFLAGTYPIQLTARRRSGAALTFQ